MSPHRDPFFLIGDLSEDQYSWRGLWALLVIYFGTMVFAALAAPPVYGLVTGWAEAAPNDLNRYLAGKLFPDYFDRLRWLPVLIGLPWLAGWCGLLSWRRLGFAAPGPGLGEFGSWFGIGLVMLGPLVLIFAWRQPDVLSWDASFAVRVAAGALGSAVLIGFIEETVFRGLVFRMFNAALTPAVAMATSTLFFAYTHFKFPKVLWTEVPPESVGWTEGFRVMAWTVGGVIHGFQPLAFLNLVLAGWILTLVFLRTRSLWSCAGLHAGWVAVLLFMARVLRDAGIEAHPFWGSHRITDGWAAAVLMAAVGCFLHGSVARARD